MRTIALVLGLLVAILGMMNSLTIGSNELQISSPWYRAILVSVGLLIALLAIFFRHLFESVDGQESVKDRSDATQREASTEHPQLPEGLYRWEESAHLTFTRLLEKSIRLNISGRTAVNILSRNELEVGAFLRRGGRLRLVVLDPASADGLDIYTEPTADLKDNLSRGLRYASALSEAHPGRVEVRVTARPPTLGIVWTEGSETSQVVPGVTSVMQLKLYLDHSVTGAGRPHVAVSSGEPWYRVLTEDFEAVWLSAVPVSPLQGDANAVL